MSFELSFQRSFDASFRRSFAASDVRSDALSFEMSDARSDEASFGMSDGRSYEVSFRVSVLRCFPANSETSFLASFQRSHPRNCRVPNVECRLRTRPLLKGALRTPSASLRAGSGTSGVTLHPICVHPCWPQRPLSDSARDRGIELRLGSGDWCTADGDRKTLSFEGRGKGVRVGSTACSRFS